MDGKTVKHVEITKHLGTGVSTEELVVQEMVQKGRNSFYSILSLGKTIKGNNPAVANKLFWSTMIPSMSYGVQVLCVSEKAMDRLEK